MYKDACVCVCQCMYGVRVAVFLGLYFPRAGYKEVEVKESLSKSPEWAKLAV